MLQMFPEATSFGTEFARSLGSGLGQGVSKQADFARQMALEEKKASLKKRADETEKFSSGLDIVQKMRDLVKKGNIGRGSAIMGFFPGETARDRAEFAQLGTALIPLVAAGVPIRNQKEFEQYKKIITDPSALTSDMSGALDALEQVFQQKLQGKEEPKEEKKGKVQFDPKNKEHQAKAKQLFKTYGNKEKVREALKREFEGL